jgi:hypothetical protein
MAGIKDKQRNAEGIGRNGAINQAKLLHRFSTK